MSRRRGDRGNKRRGSSSSEPGEVWVGVRWSRAKALPPAIISSQVIGSESPPCPGTTRPCQPPPKFERHSQGFIPMARGEAAPGAQINIRISRLPREDTARHQ